MKTEKPIKLRGHHVCSVGEFFFFSRPEYNLPNHKSSKFIEDLLENPNQKVKLVENQPDPICEHYCDQREPGCFTKDITDRMVACFFGFKIGKIYAIAEIIKAVKRNEPLVYYSIFGTFPLEAQPYKGRRECF